VAKDGVVVGEVDEEVDAFVSASTTEHRVGNYVVRETTVYASRDGSAKLSPAILRATGGQKDVDVHVGDLEAGSYVFIMGGAGMMDRWVRVQGDAVRTSRTP
jgi:hypothetical protein